MEQMALIQIMQWAILKASHHAFDLNIVMISFLFCISFFLTCVVVSWLMCVLHIVIMALCFTPYKDSGF